MFYNSKAILIFSVTLSILIDGTVTLPATKKNWALLVAGSAGYDNYRHQADICHAYQLLKSNGIPDEQIIVMMTDDVAYSTDNPTKGKLINYPGGPDVYQGVQKDYTGADVNPTVFLNVLKGNSSGLKGIGSGRVIESDSADHIFVNFVDHGGMGILCFPDDVLHADDFISVLNEMSRLNQFSKMVMYIEACYAGSMFDDLLMDDLNIFVVTAADPHESSYACYFDEERQTYLADVFSLTWLNDSEHESSFPSLHHQFEKVRTYTNTSHVEEYGDLDVGAAKLEDFIGFHTEKSGENKPIYYKQSIPLKDVIDNLDVPLTVLNKKLERTKNVHTRKVLKKKIRLLFKAHKTIDTVFNRIVGLVAIEETKRIQLKTSTFALGRKNFPCYKQALNELSEKCFNISKNPYVRKHLQLLVNMCAVSYLTTKNVLQGIDAACEEKMVFSY